MFPRTRLPTSFLVGMFSAIALGLAWGLVFFNLPPPPAPVAMDEPTYAPPLSSLPSAGDTLTTVPSYFSSVPPLAVTPSDSATASPAGGPPPAPAISSERALPPPASKSPQNSSAAKPTRTSKQPTVAPLAVPPAENIPALQGISPECMVELEKLCEGVEPGGARRKCFKENEAKLSPACQHAVDKMAARITEDMQHFKAACQGDVKQYCPHVNPGGGNILQCLEENYKEVSENCYDALKRFQKMKAGRSL